MHAPHHGCGRRCGKLDLALKVIKLASQAQASERNKAYHRLLDRPGQEDSPDHRGYVTKPYLATIVACYLETFRNGKTTDAHPPSRENKGGRFEVDKRV